MTSEDRQARAEMWENFFWACELGTVVVDAEARVWQKRGKQSWQSVGMRSDYTPDSIRWPVDVLMGGIG